MRFWVARNVAESLNLPAIFPPKRLPSAAPGAPPIAPPVAAMPVVIPCATPARSRLCCCTAAPGYLNEGKHDGSEISKVIDGYQADQDRIESSAAAQAFVNHFHWDPSLSDAEFLAEAEAVASRAPHLDAYFVTGLHQLISSLEGGTAVADRMAEAWLVQFEKRAGDADFAESPFHRPLLPRFKAAFDAARAARIDKGSLPEVVAGLVEKSGWGHRDEAVMKRATAKDFEDAMRSLKGHEFKLFMLKNLDIVEHGETYDRHFGEARLRFLEACRAVCESSNSPRLGKIVRELFADSKVPRAFDAPSAEQIESKGVVGRNDDV